MRLEGRAWKFGDNVDTDVIIPARYLTLTSPEELGKHCMEDADPEFASKIRQGDVMVAGSLFGCGSSREHAPLAIKGAGISAVIATSFARIFLRNAINVGLPVLECSTAYGEIQPGDALEIELITGEIINRRSGAIHRASSYPEFMLGIIRAGGLVNYTIQKLRAQP